MLQPDVLEENALASEESFYAGYIARPQRQVPLGNGRMQSLHDMEREAQRNFVRDGEEVSHWVRPQRGPIFSYSRVMC
jgi:hypothetical protein